MKVKCLIDQTITVLYFLVTCPPHTHTHTYGGAVSQEDNKNLIFHITVHKPFQSSSYPAALI